METWKEALIGFGSNLGDSRRICREAIDALKRDPRIDIRAVSSLYRTRPVGGVEQGWFLNGVILARTALDPWELLECLQKLELDFGRTREVHWGPRTLDLDILAFGEEIIASATLNVPHPLLHERLFVLIPMAEIAPAWVHPVLGSSIRRLLDRRLNAVHEEEAVRMEMTLWD